MCINIWMFVSLCLYLSVCVLCLRECSSASCLVLFLRLPVIFVLPLTLTSPKWHVRTPLSTKVCIPKLSPVYVYSFAQFTQGSLGIEMLVTRLKSQKRQCRQLYADRYISLQILCIVQIKYSNKCWSQIHHTMIPFISMYFSPDLHFINYIIHWKFNAYRCASSLELNTPHSKCVRSQSLSFIDCFKCSEALLCRGGFLKWCIYTKQVLYPALRPWLSWTDMNIIAN